MTVSDDVSGDICNIAPAEMIAIEKHTTRAMMSPGFGILCRAPSIERWSYIQSHTQPVDMFTAAWGFRCITGPWSNNEEPSMYIKSAGRMRQRRKRLWSEYKKAVVIIFELWLGSQPNPLSEKIQAGCISSPDRKTQVRCRVSLEMICTSSSFEEPVLSFDKKTYSVRDKH